MVQYATASELASYLQEDVDTATATLLLTTASGLFDGEAGTTFASTTLTWSTTDANGCTQLDPPYRPVTAVSAVRVNGVAIAGWVLRCNLLYRSSGFGLYRGWGWPPDQVDVDLTYGHSTVPDDVKAAVLESAATGYTRPVGAVLSEKIDDYAVQYTPTGGGVQLTPSAQAVAAGYRGILIA
jgi:hypothetical protein